MHFYPARFLRPLSFLILFFFSAFGTIAQDTTGVFRARNALYVEGGGRGPYYSLNYDRVFRVRPRWSYSYRVGFSIVADGISMPLGINAFTTPGRHHLEVGLGLTPYIDHYRTFLAKDDASDKYLYIVPSIGYRYQKPEGGWFFSAGLTPLIMLDPPSYDVLDVSVRFIPSAALALGVSF